MHMNRHTGIGPHSCPGCAKRYMTPLELGFHKRYSNFFYFFLHSYLPKNEIQLHFILFFYHKIDLHTHSLQLTQTLQKVENKIFPGWTKSSAISYKNIFFYHKIDLHTHSLQLTQTLQKVENKIFPGWT